MEIIMDGMPHMFVHEVHIGNAAMDEDTVTGLGRACHKDGVQCVEMKRNESVSCMRRPAHHSHRSLYRGERTALLE